MYTQNINIKSNCEDAKFKEFPNKKAIEQMQLMQNYQNKTKTTSKTNNIQQNTLTNNEKNIKSSDVLMPLILSLIFSDCNIESEDIFTILMAGILTL